MPRVAIVTPYGLWNYGNRLQNFAVNRALSERGLAVETLVLRRRYPLDTLKDVALGAGHKLHLRGQASRKYANFYAFDRTIRKRRVWSDRHLLELGRQYEFYVFGSDQIWNPYYCNFAGAEYGNFVSTGRKLALSASFGVSELPDWQMKRLPSYLEGFSAISVREHAGQDIIRRATGVEVPLLIDPTLSIDAADWLALADSRMKPRHRYVFRYLLGAHEDNAVRRIDAKARERNLDVVALMSRAKPQFFSAGPQDFLGLIAGAEEVIADSFHAAIFAILFRKPFLWVERPGSLRMSSRFETLIELLDLQKREAQLPGCWELRPRSDDRLERTLVARRREFDEYVTTAVTRA